MWRKTIVMGIAVLSLAGPLQAQARCTCYLPEKPAIPDGATAEASQIKYAKHQLDAYQRKMSSYKQCLEQCLVNADNRENRVVKAWNATVKTYNARQEASR